MRYSVGYCEPAGAAPLETFAPDRLEATKRFDDLVAHCADAGYRVHRTNTGGGEITAYAIRPDGSDILLWISAES